MYTNTMSCSLANIASEGVAASSTPAPTTNVPSRWPAVAASRMAADATSVSMLLRAAHTTRAHDTTSNNAVPSPHITCSRPGSAHATEGASKMPTAVHSKAP